MTDSIYLDNHASTPCDARVVEAMLPFFRQRCANPSSDIHSAGKLARKAVEDAREHVAALIGASRGEILFTAGATESNNLALLGIAQRGRFGPRKKLLTTPIEHKSVLGPLRHLATVGFQTCLLAVDSQGTVLLESGWEHLNHTTLLLSVQLANNEIGTIQVLPELSEMAHKFGVLVHTDAAQAVGRIAVDVDELDVDFLSLSAHKLYGPKGVGALYLRGGPRAAELEPVLFGGGQEGGLRSGTLNVPGIVGLGEAARLSRESLKTEQTRIATLRDRFEAELLARHPSLRRNGNLARRIPGNSSLSFPGVEGEALVLNCPELALTTGAACTSGALEPSHVLTGIGLDTPTAYSTLRIGIGRFNTADEIATAADVLAAAYDRLRAAATSADPSA